MAKVKGVALISRLQTIKSEFGQESLDKVLENMKSQNREMLASTIPSSWYDADIFKDFNESIQRTLSSVHSNIMERIGELTAEESLKGVYKTRLKEGDVYQTLSRAALLWKAFHDTGELSVEMTEGEKKVTLRVAGFALPHVENCKNLIGWGRRMIELSGGTNVKIEETKCMNRGDECCEMVAVWD